MTTSRQSQASNSNLKKFLHHINDQPRAILSKSVEEYQRPYFKFEMVYLTLHAPHIFGRDKLNFYFALDNNGIGMTQTKKRKSCVKAFFNKL